MSTVVRGNLGLNEETDSVARVVFFYSLPRND